MFIYLKKFKFLVQNNFYIKLFIILLIIFVGLFGTLGYFDFIIVSQVSYNNLVEENEILNEENLLLKKELSKYDGVKKNIEGLKANYKRIKELEEFNNFPKNNHNPGDRKW